MPEPLDLEPIRAREQAATPGSWHVTDINVDIVACAEHDDELTARGEEIPRCDDCRVVAGMRTLEDAHFIANARADIPALLAEVDRLRGFEAAVRAAHKSGWERRATAGRVLDDIGGALDALEAARGGAADG